ncbi:hypothetical protein DE146DRAFT_58225 [Phaeosphaeria sp. MPI-PUGE-AT-0046c]|nr:hypothetical protein DE146DRAFT_58225 [Phaeosphaeria sp. MPI-PUGE-AT-0046c]
MSLLTVLSVASAFVNVAQAYSAEDVGYAVDVLKDLPEDLASPFCSGYAVGSGETVTETYTSAEYTTTTTLGCDEVPSGYPAYGKPHKTDDSPYPGITEAPNNPWVDPYGTASDPIDWFITSTTTTTITVTSYS